MAILTREDSTNISLLLARPETEVRKWDTLRLRGARSGKRPQNAPLPFVSIFMALGNEFTRLGLWEGGGVFQEETVGLGRSKGACKGKN